MTNEYVQGALMAYEDSARIIDLMADELPEDTAALEKGLRLISQGIRTKKTATVLLLGYPVEGEA